MLLRSKTLFVLSLVTFSTLHLQCEEIGRRALKTFSKKYETDSKVWSAKPLFLGADAKRTQISISLREVTQIKEPTDIQFFPGDTSFLFLLEKSGNLILFDRESKKQRTIHTFGVLTDSEEGLLGLAFSPDFAKDQLVYVNYVKEKTGKDYTTISEIKISNPKDFQKMKVESERVLLEVLQPYPNHNAGQLLFGQDRLLYIGLGDGGLRADPKNHGQNPLTLLGSILRIDPKAGGDKPYSIPPSNPYIAKEGFLPEIFAYGIRNPWRFSFAPNGALIVADVGQDKYEEINIIESGKNYGWSQTEGFHCFESNCDLGKYAKPFYEYAHDEGQSITGGYVYTGSEILELKGKYIFGDFIAGRIWALNIPEPGKVVQGSEVLALGKWNLLISTFGIDQRGEVFLADYQTGKIFKITKPE